MTPQVESMMAAILQEIEGQNCIAVGAASPLPGTVALLARALSGGKLRVLLLGSVKNNDFTDGGRELFDCAAQGRIDTFFLSGVQIDGEANINLLGLGPYPNLTQRFSGSFGSAYLYFLVPKVILFREEHSPKTLVKQVDFISAPGRSAPGVYRPGGPAALVTGKAVFSFDRDKGRFCLQSMTPGETRESIRAATGFAYNEAPVIGETPQLTAEARRLLKEQVAEEVAEIYPAFARQLI